MNLAESHILNNSARDQSFPSGTDPVPAHLMKRASITQIWESLVQSGATASLASKRMQVSLSDANAGLAEAARRLRQRRKNCEKAETVLTASGAVKQDIPRRAWDDVALGLKAA